MIFKTLKSLATITLSDDRRPPICDSAFLNKDLTIHAIKPAYYKTPVLYLLAFAALLSLSILHIYNCRLQFLSLLVFGGSGGQPLFEGTPRSAVSLKTTDDSDVISTVSVKLLECVRKVEELFFVFVIKGWKLKMLWLLVI